MKNILIAILAVIIILLTLSFFGNSRKINSLTTSLTLADSAVNSLNKVVYSKDVQLSSSQSQIRSLTDSLFHMGEKHEKEIKKIHAFYSGKTTVTIKEVPVPYVDKPAMKKWEDSVSKKCDQVINYYELNTIPVDTKASVSDPYYSFSATIKKDTLLVHNLTFTDTQYIRFVTVKKFLHRKKIKVEVTHTNPYFKNQGVSAMLYTPPKQHLFLKGAAVGAAGYFIIVNILPLIK